MLPCPGYYKQCCDEHWGTRVSLPSGFLSVLFNMQSQLVIAFLPRSKCLLISWLQSPSAVILESKKMKPVAVSPSICHEIMGPDVMLLTVLFVNCIQMSGYTPMKK